MVGVFINIGECNFAEKIPLRRLHALLQKDLIEPCDCVSDPAHDQDVRRGGHRGQVISVVTNLRSGRTLCDLTKEQLT